MPPGFIYGTNFPPGSLPGHLKPKPANHTERFWSFLADCAFFSTTSGETFLAPSSIEAPSNAPGLLIPINHPSCRQFLCQQYTRRFGSSPPPGALRSALARAHDSARAAALSNFSPALRVASVTQLDRPAKASDPTAIAIRHGRSHWHITAEGLFDGSSHEPQFYTGRGSLPLPQPDPNAPAAALDDFFHLLRIPAGPARLRCLTWLLSAFRPIGPYPILILRGPSGSGKSFAARALRALTDANDIPLHPLPPSPNQLRQLAYENWVLAFDHVTRFPLRTTESLARLTENEIHYLPPKRDPAAVSLARPMVLTVTDSCHIPPEIAARSLTVELPAMPDTERKSEAELQPELEALLPPALARVLKALSTALAHPTPQTRTFPLPRLAGAATWVIAAAPALGLTPPEILQALSSPVDPLVERIATLMQSLEIWRGSATQLAAGLNLDLDASQLGRQLFQNQAALDSLGLAITRCHGRLSRSIEITHLDQKKLDQNLQNAVTPSPGKCGAGTPACRAETRLSAYVPHPEPNPQPRTRIKIRRSLAGQSRAASPPALTKPFCLRYNYKLDRRSLPMYRFRSLLLTALAAVPLSAQIELSGVWQNKLHEDFPDRLAGPELGDYTGIPLNAASRFRAEAWDASLIALPEYQCRVHPSDYAPSFADIRIWEEFDKDTQSLIAIHIHHFAWGTERTIWIDGRPHPPDYAAHTSMGFSTGKWDGDILTVTTDHLKEGWIRRNGVPRSDRAVLTEHFIRHDNGLTWVTIIHDPAYLTEDMIRSRDYVWSVAGQIAPYPCESVEEVIRPKGVIPHHLPGTNTFLKEYQKNHGVLEEGAMGGAQTLYPDYRQNVIAAGDLGGKAPGPLQ